MHSTLTVLDDDGEDRNETPEDDDGAGREAQVESGEEDGHGEHGDDVAVVERCCGCGVAGRGRLAVVRRGEVLLSVVVYGQRSSEGQMRRTTRQGHAADVQGLVTYS